MPRAEPVTGKAPCARPWCRWALTPRDLWTRGAVSPPGARAQRRLGGSARERTASSSQVQLRPVFRWHQKCLSGTLVQLGFSAHISSRTPRCRRTRMTFRYALTRRRAFRMGSPGRHLPRGELRALCPAPGEGESL